MLQSESQLLPCRAIHLLAICTSHKFNWLLQSINHPQDNTLTTFTSSKSTQAIYQNTKTMSDLIVDFHQTHRRNSLSRPLPPQRPINPRCEASFSSGFAYCRTLIRVHCKVPLRRLRRQNLENLSCFGGELILTEVFEPRHHCEEDFSRFFSHQASSRQS